MSPPLTRSLTSTPSVVGKYRPIAELGRGGMARVFLAMAGGPGGFNKLFVLKEPWPSAAPDPKGPERLLREARIAARLSHANVVQTVEVLSEGEGYFIVMEYLDGQPLDRVVRRAGAASSALPLALHLRVLCDVLAGLHYAHELCGYDGTPLNIVHRDVSPQNVFLTYDGQVKLVDFGIAKSASEGADTTKGAIKGKIRYMAPEQASGAEVDRRADVFALGVMLWEALAGRRMWGELGEGEVVIHLVTKRIPPASEAAPQAPPELLRICDRSLAAEPEGRYASAGEMRVELERVLASLPAHDVGLGPFVSGLFADDRRQVAELINAHARAELENTRPAPTPSSPALAPTLGPSLPSLARALGPDATTAGTLEASSARVSSGPGRKRSALGFGLVALGVAAFATALALQRRTTPEAAALRSASAASTASALVAVGVASAEPATIAITLHASPAGALVFLDDKLLPSNPYTLRVAPDGERHQVRAEARGFQAKNDELRFDHDASIGLTLEREARPTSPTPAPATPATPATPAKTTKPTRRLDVTNPY